MDDWSTLLSGARRMANLTQEDFAADMGVTRVTLAHWENGRRPIPAKVKRRILDFMGGYYHGRPEFKKILTNAEDSGAFVTLYQPGFIIRGATSYARHTWKEVRNTEMVGQHILPLVRREMRLLEYYEIYYESMLRGSGDIVSVSYFDESFLFPGRIIKAMVSVVTVGEGRILHMENVYLPAGTEGSALLEKGVRIITMDDVGADFPS